MYGIIIVVLPHMIRKVIHMQLKFRKEERLMDLEMVKYLAKLGKLSFTDEELDQIIAKYPFFAENCFVVPKVVE